MKQTRKSRNWHFGMKLHIGADKHGVVYTVRATDAAVADVTQLPKINRRPGGRHPLSERWRMIKRARSRTRACDEHAFRVLKQLWDCTKVREPAWPRTWRGLRPCSPWLISSECGISAPGWGEMRPVSRVEQTMRAADNCSVAKNTACAATLFFPQCLIILSIAAQ